MSAHAGTLTPAEAPLLPLGLVPLVPLLAAVLVALLGGRLGRRRASALSLGGLAIAALLALTGVFRLAELEPARRVLLDPGVRLVRIGSLEASLSFLFDPLAACVVLAALVGAAFVPLQLLRARHDERAAARLSACASLFASGISLVALAADAVVWLFGSALVTLATVVLVGGARASQAAASAGLRGLIVAVLGTTTVLAGFALLFWGLGGAWLDEGRYLADYRPRFVAVHPEGRIPIEETEVVGVDVPRGERDPRVIAEQAQKRGYLTFTSHPGARVYLGISDRAQLERDPPPFAVAPFIRREIPAGAHSIVIVPGGGATVAGDGNENAFIERLVVPTGDEVRIVPIGQTLSFVEIRDQLLLRDELGAPGLLRAFLHKPFVSSIRLVTIVCLLLFLGALAASAAPPFSGWLADASSLSPWPARALLLGIALAPGPLLLARLDILFAQSDVASGIVVIASGLAVAIAIVRASAHRDLGRVLAHASTALVGLSFVALGLGASSFALVLVALHLIVVAAVCFFLSRGKKRAARAVEARLRPLPGAPLVLDLERRQRGFGETLIEIVTPIARAALRLVRAIDDIVLGFPARIFGRFFVGLLVFAAALGLASPALADASAPSGLAVLRAEQGDIVELSLGPDGEHMIGAFFVRNEGTGPLTIARADVLTAPSEPRTPSGLLVSVDGGRAGMRVLPGQERRVTVKWRYEIARAREIYGHVVVETDARSAFDAGEPGRPLAIGVHAERPLGLGPLGRTPLSFLVFSPLLVTLLALVLRIARRDDGRVLAIVGALVHGALLVFVAWLGYHFDRFFTRTHGNDGYQLIERAPLLPSIGVEWSVGLDGVALVLAGAAVLAGLVASIASASLRDRPFTYHALAGLFLSASLGVLVSLDLFLFCAFWIAAIVPACLLVARPASAGSRRAALRLLVSSLLGAILLCAAAWFLWKNSDPTYLSTGEAVHRTSAIPELARVVWLDKGLRIFGLSGVKVLWIALFAAFSLRLSAFPFPGYLAEVNAEAEGSTRVLLSGVLLGAPILGLLRLNVGLLPEATRWAATTVASFGASAIVVSAFAALGEADLERFLSRVSVAHVGVAFVGIGSLTPQGFQASVIVIATQGFIVGLLHLLASALDARVWTRDLGRFGGLSRDMPIFSLLFGVGMLASLGLPILAGFWGPFLAVVGVFARNRLLAGYVLFGLVTLACVHVFALSHLVFGEPREEWSRSLRLQKFGGKFPELRARELVAVLPLALVILAVGVAPQLLLGLLDQACLEIHRLVDAPGPTQIA